MLQPQSVKLDSLIGGQPNSVKLDSIELLIRPDGAGRYSIWSEVCPHEGGPLKQGKLCGDEIQCPWHGLKFAPVKLSSEKSSGTLGNLQLNLDGATQELRVSSSEP